MLSSLLKKLGDVRFLNIAGFRLHIQKSIVLLVISLTALTIWRTHFSDYHLEDSLPINEARAAVAPVLNTFSPLEEETSSEWHSKLDSLKQKKRVTAWITKRFNIAERAANLFVRSAYQTGFELGLDPHLILAVIAIESRFEPSAESNMGAQGLMQVLTKVHADRFKPYGGSYKVFDPETNIKVGSEILKNYLKQTGSVKEALKVYVGAANMRHDGGYSKKVLNEFRLMKLVASGHPVSEKA